MLLEIQRLQIAIVRSTYGFSLQTDRPPLCLKNNQGSNNIFLREQITVLDK